MRLAAIAQLCLAFSLILWILGQPFVGDHFSTRSTLLFFQAVTGTGTGPLPADKLARHAQRFAQLDPVRQQTILTAYATLEQHAQRSFLAKTREALLGLAVTSPLFLRSWLILAIALSVMLLRGRPGASIAAWLLPIVALCYAMDNRLTGVQPLLSPDHLLLPTEKQLAERYGALLGLTIEEQRAGLTRAWQQYLISEWAHQIPSADPIAFREQVETGEHALTLKRLEARLPLIAQPPLHTVTSWLVLALFCIWNLCFAIAVQKGRQ